MRLAFLVLLAFSASACDSSSEGPASTVFVGNRGTGDADGTVTRADVAGGAVETLGDFGGRVQSLVVRGRRLHVLVDRAELGLPEDDVDPQSRLVTIDLDTGVRSTTPVRAPRRMAVVNGTGYVTDFSAFALSPVYLATGQTGPLVRVGDNPVGVAAVGNRVFVATWAQGLGHDVRVVSAENNTVVQILEVGCDGPRELVVDGDGEVWAFCTGRPATAEAPATNGQVVVLDGANGAIVARIELDAPLGTADVGQDAVFDETRDEMVAVVGTSLLRFDTTSNTLVGQVETGGAIGAVAVDGPGGRLVVARSGVGGANGTVSILDWNGAETGRFAAGVAPGAIALLPQ